jgi:hypothetical protein
MNEFLTENWHWILVTGYELIVRAIPTSKTWSIFVLLSKVMQLIPDRAKKGDGVSLDGEYVHVVKVDKRKIW